MGKLKNGKAADKDEFTGEMMKDEGLDLETVIFLLVFCLKTRGLLGLLHCTRVKDRGLNVVIIAG